MTSGLGGGGDGGERAGKQSQDQEETNGWMKYMNERQRYWVKE